MTRGDEGRSCPLPRLRAYSHFMLESGGLVCDRSRGRIGLGLEVGAGLEAEWPGNEAAWNPQDQLVVIPYPLVIPPPLHRYPVFSPCEFVHQTQDDLPAPQLRILLDDGDQTHRQLLELVGRFDSLR